MTVALHRDCGVDLHLTARGEQQQDRHRSCDAKQTGAGTGHGPDATSAHSRRIDESSHDPMQNQCHEPLAIVRLPPDVERVLSIDEDTIVRDDLTALWPVDPSGIQCGGV